MSDLRKQLQAARELYRSQRYRGDLAAELLPASRHAVLKIFATAAAVSGIAAAILIWVASHPTMPAPGRTSPAIFATSRPSAEDAITPMTALASPPSFPRDIPMTPSLDSTDGSVTPMAPSLESIEIGSMPSMPSLDMNFSDTTTSQTSKEST
jgi:hypothetical protein